MQNVHDRIADDFEDHEGPDEPGEIQYARWSLELLASATEQIKNAIATSGADGRYRNRGKYIINPHCKYKPRDPSRVRVVKFAELHISSFGPSTLKELNDMFARQGIDTIQDHGSPAFWLTRQGRRVIIPQ